MNNSSRHGLEDAAPGLDDSASLDNAIRQPGTPEYLQHWLATYYAAMLERANEIARER